MRHNKRGKKLKTGAGTGAEDVYISPVPALPRIRKLGVEDLPPVRRAKWYAVHTRSREEAVANFHLRRSGYWTFYPQRLVRIKHARRETDELRPFLPRYVFAQVLPTQDPFNINSLPGVSTIIFGVDGPMAIPEKQMAALFNIAAPDGLIRLPTETEGKPQREFKVGSCVRIGEGPFASFPGIVEGVDEHGALRLSVMIFGRETPITLPAEWVERA